MNRKKIYIILGVALSIVTIVIIALIASSSLKKKFKPEKESDDIKGSKNIKENDDIKGSKNIKENDGIKGSEIAKEIENTKGSKNFKENDGIKGSEIAKEIDNTKGSKNIKEIEDTKGSKNIKGIENTKENDDIEGSKNIKENDIIKENPSTEKNSNQTPIDITNKFDGISNLKDYKLLKLDDLFNQIHREARDNIEKNKEFYKEVKNNLSLEFDSFIHKFKPSIYQDELQCDLVFTEMQNFLKNNFTQLKPMLNVSHSLRAHYIYIFSIFQILNLDDMHFCPYFAVIDDNSKGFLSVIHDDNSKIFGFIIVTNFPFNLKNWKLRKINLK